MRDRVWFIPELVLFLLVLGTSWGTAVWYLNSIREETALIQAQTEDIVQEITKLQSDVERFEQIAKQIEAIKQKLSSLENITVSKVERYLPIIVLEYLQGMKPEGMWFNSLRQNSKDQMITLEGGSFDNLLIAEFMNSLEQTKKQAVNVQDVRSYVFFSHFALGKISTEGTGQISQEAPAQETDAQKSFQKISTFKNKKSGASENKMFPELKKFPAYTLMIKYAERATSQMNKNLGKSLNGSR